MTIKQIAQELERRGIECTVIAANHGHDVIIDLDWSTMKKVADEFNLDMDIYRIRDGHHTYEHRGWTFEPFNIEQVIAENNCNLSTYNNDDIKSVNDWYGDMLADAEEDEAKAAIIVERDAVLKALNEIDDDQFITVCYGEIEVYDKIDTCYRHDVYGYAIGLSNPSEDELIEQVKQERCAAVEIYEYTTARRVHTDYLRSLDLRVKDLKGRKGEVIIMNEEEYNNTILANSCEKANFEELYDDDLALVCVVIVEKENL